MDQKPTRRELPMPESALKNWFLRIPRPYRVAFFSTIVFSLLIHFSVYVTPLFSHDSIMIHQQLFGTWSDRFFANFIYLLYDGLQVSWPIALLTMTLFGVSTALLAAILDIRKTGPVVLLSGIVVAFPTVISIHCHLFAAPAFAFALMSACLAVLLLERWKRGWIAAIPLFILCCFTYSAYITLAASLMLLCLLRRICRQNETTRTVLLRGLLYFGVLAVSAGVYYLVWQLGVKLTGQVVSSYRSKDMVGLFGLPEVLQAIGSAYRSVIEFFLIRGQKSYYPVVLYLAFWPGLIAAIAVFLMSRGKPLVRSAGKFILALVCFALLPLAMDAMYVLNIGEEPHLLMRYAYILPWLFMIKMYDVAESRPAAGSKKRRWMAILAWCMVLVCSCTIYKNAILANETYLKLKLNYDASVSTATRLIDRIETEPGYTSETQVVFVGMPAYPETREGFKHTKEITGAWMTRSFTFGEYLRSFIQQQLGTQIDIVIDDETYLARGDVQALSNFPAQDCMLWDDNVLIVKLGGDFDAFWETEMSDEYLQ